MPASTRPPTKKPSEKLMEAAVIPPSGPRIGIATAPGSTRCRDHPCIVVRRSTAHSQAFASDEDSPIMMTRSHLTRAMLLALSLVLGASPGSGATIQIINKDGAGEGFNDGTVTPAIGG